MSDLKAENYISGSSYLALLLAVLLRWCIALHSYSGEKTPPMFGDYEAQRHWMEITYNTPLKYWYQNTNDNNLTYWGLDYPPLTAYHSFICGYFASLFVPEGVELHSSRGHESYRHKLFMRYAVYIVDLLIYIPALYWYFRNIRKFSETRYSNVGLLFSIFYPGLILIDYGHFQFNCVSLGFFVASLAAILSQKYKTAAFMFSLAVNYKQMELYHSLPFFFFFLGKFFSLSMKRGLFQGLKFIIPIGLAVLTTFFCIWFPFLLDFASARQVVHRIFPVARGVFEDKVSTFWCILNVFVKIHQNFSNDTMVRMCLLVTLLSVLPSVIDLMVHPTFEKFKLSLIICSLCFFLFSYHVHEKSILLVAIPVTLDFTHRPNCSFLFLCISTFSMLPLLIKDELFLPYISLFILYIVCSKNVLSNHVIRVTLWKNKLHLHSEHLVNLSLMGCFVLSVIARFFPAPLAYPHLWSLIVCFYSFVHFMAFLVYYYYLQCGFIFM